jgi:hypothetical protein
MSEYGLKQGVENLGRGFAKIVIIVGLGLVVLSFLYDWFAPLTFKIKVKYGVSDSAITIEPKPHGCEFADAPLGNKHCHYEPIVVPEKTCDTCPVVSVHVAWLKVEE